MTEQWGVFKKKPVEVMAYRTYKEIQISTLEGVMTAKPGDWVIRGVKEEIYPCKDSIFRETYEPVGVAAETVWNMKRKE